MIKVIIIEDSRPIREGLKILIDGTENYSVIGAYESCESFIKVMHQMKPDVILMDIDLPGMSGIEGIKKIRTVYKNSTILMLTIYDENELIFDALCAGASGYLVKKTPPARLLEAIEEAYEGGAPMSANIAKKVVEFFQRSGTEKQSDNSTQLTQREKEVLKKLIQGNSCKSIASSLFISVDTVRYHFKNVYKKLHVHSQTELVVKAINEKLV